ncbi:retrovirus-related pol polyprotein from transposon TNT 1-94 [Tanacetum coccineum]
MLCYLAGMEPYYLKCIKDGPFQPKTAEGDAKPESQWTQDERRVVIQDQRLKSIIMSCLPDDIMEYVISCVSAKETWTDLVHSFEGPSDINENRIMDLKLEYQTFKAKSTESLLQTYTRYKTLFNELANDDFNLSKHEINTLDLADIYGRFFYEDNLIQRRYSDTKKALVTTPSSTPISTAFFSNNSSSNSNNQADTKFQKDYKAEYKKMKAKLALLEASPSSSQNPKSFQLKNKEQLKEEKKINEKWLTSSKKVSQCISGKIPHQKKKVLGGEVLTDSSSKMNENENLFIPASMGKLPNFNTGRILVPESQAVNESLEPTETLNIPESSKGSEAESLTPLPPLKNLQGALPSSERYIKEPIWYLDSGCSRSMTGVKSYLYKYVEQLGPKLESFCDEKGISQNFSSPYTLEQNGVAERKNRTLIEAARTMLNGLVLSKHFWTDAVRIACYTQNRSIIVKRHDKTSYELFRERIPDISYFHVFGCPVFIYNHKDHLGKVDAKADDGYFLGYSSVSKAFRVYNTRRQQIEETYHVMFDESMEAIRFTNTTVDEIGIDDSSRYPPDEFQEDDPSRQYQIDFDVSYYIIPYERSLTEITQENHAPEVIALNEPEIPHTEDTEGPPDLINTEGTHKQNVQNDQMITQPTDAPSGNDTKGSEFITEPLVPDVTQSHISNQASTSEGMLTRSMVAKLTSALVNECLFANFLSEIEPKKVSEALKHPGWIDAMQEELNHFYKNKVWTLVPLPYGKITIGSKWVFRNKKDKHGTTTKNKARLVAQGYSQEEGINNDETFTLMARMEALRIFLAFATYMNFKVY